MRLSVPNPDNPWPHDMAITVEDNPKALTDLLWVREAWSLEPQGEDLPPLLSVGIIPGPTETSSQLGHREQWQNAWPEIWSAALDHAGRVDTESLFTQLHQTANGSVERAELLRELFGPDWRDTFGDDAFTEQYRAWVTAGFEARSQGHLRPLEKEPERVSLAALTPAWRAGLTKIITIPCIGNFTRKIGPHVLLVTAETRQDPNRYSESLSQFG